MKLNYLSHLFPPLPECVLSVFRIYNFVRYTHKCVYLQCETIGLQIKYFTPCVRIYENARLFLAPTSSSSSSNMTAATSRTALHLHSDYLKFSETIEYKTKIYIFFLAKFRVTAGDAVSLFSLCSLYKKKEYFASCHVARFIKVGGCWTSIVGIEVDKRGGGGGMNRRVEQGRCCVLSGARKARGGTIRGGEKGCGRRGGPRSRGCSRGPRLASGVVRHVERDSGCFVVWHVVGRAATTGSPVLPNYKTNVARLVIIQLAERTYVRTPIPPLVRRSLPSPRPLPSPSPLTSNLPRILFFWIYEYAFVQEVTKANHGDHFIPRRFVARSHCYRT